MRTKYLVCYDIAAPRRLVRVYRYMKAQGWHLQFSVFLCSLTWPELTRIKAGLRELLNETEDDVRIYPVPAEGTVVALGRGDRVPDGVWFQFN